MIKRLTEYLDNMDPNEECNCGQALLLMSEVKLVRKYMDGLQNHILEVAKETHDITPAWQRLINYVKIFGDNI